MLPRTEIQVNYLTWIREVMRTGFANIGGKTPKRFLTYSHVVPDDRMVARHIRMGADPGRFGKTDPWGNQDLVEKLAARYRIDPDRLMVTSGASQGYGLLCRTLLSAGDHVAVEDPVYEPLVAVPRFLGTKISKIPRRMENGYRIDGKDVNRAVSSRTALVVVTNLHNPTGALLEPEDLRELLRIVRKKAKRALVCVDEVYHDFAGEGRPTTAVLDDGFVAINSVSKVFGLGFLRIGWIVSTPSRCQNLRRMMALLENTGSPITESVAAEVFGRSNLYDDHWKRVLARNRPEMNRWIKRLVDEGLVRGEVPAKGCILFPTLVGVVDTRRFAEQLAARYGVFVVPGIFFGCPKSLRLGFGGRFDDVRSGMEILADTLHAWKEKGSI